MQKIKTSLIVPDINQPRKYFSAEKMSQLKQSIKENGIINPLVVGNDYLLIDGERRFRCAQELGLTEVPVIFMESGSDQDRLIKQFHLQEQHQSWTAIEKATAIQDISKMMDMSFMETANMLGVAPGVARIYSGVFKLTNKAQFERSEINLEWARSIVGVVNSAKTICKNAEMEFNNTNAGLLEKAIIKRIKTGDVKNGLDITKLKDSFKKQPKTIKSFIEDDSLTPDKLFCSTKAKGAYYLRNLSNHAGYIIGLVKNFLEVGDTAPSVEDIRQIKTASESLKKFLDRVDRE